MMTIKFNQKVDKKNIKIKAKQKVEKEINDIHINKGTRKLETTGISIPFSSQQ